MNNNSDLNSKKAIINERYEIIEKLGSGGFGEVYKAKDTGKFDEIVVVKILKIDNNIHPIDLPVLKKLFEREAKTLHDLKNCYPEISIPSIEYNPMPKNNNQDYYFVMQYIQGKNLQEYLQEEQILEETKVIKLIKNILETIKLIHEYGVVHRDIKPDNLIIQRENGEEKLILIDFGAVSKNLLQNQYFDEKTEELNHLKTNVFNLNYSPPEQYDYTKKVNFYSDIYSIGMIATRGITGQVRSKLPINPNTGKILLTWEESPAISQEFKKIIYKMIADEPSERYQSVDEVLKDLDPLIEISSTSDKKTQLEEPRVIIPPTSDKKTQLEEPRVIIPPTSDNTQQRRGTRRVSMIALLTGLASIGLISFYVIAYLRKVNGTISDMNITELLEFPRPNQVNSNTQIRVFGSISMIYLNETIKEKFEETYLSSKIILENPNGFLSGGSDEGIKALCEGKIDLAAVSRSLNENEPCKVKGVSVGKDAIVIIVVKNDGTSFSLDNLTKEEVQSIFRCEDPSFFVIHGSLKSGTQDKFEELFLDNDLGNCLNDPDNFRRWGQDEYTGRLGFMKQESEKDPKNRTYITYAPYSYANTQRRSIKILSIDGHDPTDKEYEYKRKLYYVYTVNDDNNQPDNPKVPIFLGFVRSLFD